MSYKENYKKNKMIHCIKTGTNSPLIKTNNKNKWLEFPALPNTQKVGRFNPSFPTFPPPPPSNPGAV